MSSLDTAVRILAVAMLVPMLSSPVAASGSGDEGARVVLQRMLGKHDRLAAQEAEERGSEAAVRQAWSAWFPELDITASIGEKSGHTTSNPDFELSPQEFSVTLDQTLWDFGKTNAEISKAEVSRSLAALSSESTRQTLIFEGVSAWVDLCRAVGMVDLARKSVENIRKHTGLEESRVELGGGLPTDVLQSKSQLAGAEARLVRAKGGLALAINRYHKLFRELPPEPASLGMLEARPALLMGSLDELVAAGREGNLDLRSAALAVELAQQEERRIKGSELLPRVAAVVEYKDKDEADVTNLDQREWLAKVELSYKYNLGQGGFHALRAAREGSSAAQSRLNDVRSDTEEQLRNSWETLQTARDNANLLRNQTAITESFLNLARQERLYGRRSLLDVLSGESALYNAEADALSARADVILASFSQVRAMGRLDLDSFQKGREGCIRDMVAGTTEPPPPR